MAVLFPRLLKYVSRLMSCSGALQPGHPEGRTPERASCKVAVLWVVSRGCHSWGTGTVQGALSSRCMSRQVWHLYSCIAYRAAAGAVA